jgi:uncharacterized protein
MRALRLAAAAVCTLVVAGVAVAVYVADSVTRVERSKVDRSHLVISPTVENVSFRTADGLTLRGWLVPGARDRAAVLVHGKETNRFASDHTVRVARWLREAGFTLLLFDMRGHGESEGDRFSLGQHERKDVAAAVELLVTRGFAPGRIVLVGESMGAAVAIQGVALRSDIAGVVADSSYESGPTIVREAGPGETGLPDWYTGAIVLAARVLFGLDAAAVDPAAVVRANPTVPFLFIHCEGDTLIGPHHSRALREASADPRSVLWIAPGCGHVGASIRHGEEYRARLLGFVGSVLR